MQKPDDGACLAGRNSVFIKHEMTFRHSSGKVSKQVDICVWSSGERDPDWK